MKNLSRRNLFKVGMASAGTLTAASALASLNIDPTGEQPLGPFFPREGTPINPHREDGTPGVPLHLASDSDLTVVKGKSGKAEGQVVFVKGKVMDENNHPVKNANLVIWQASHTGRYNHLGDDDNIDFIDPRTGRVIKRKLAESFQYWGKAKTNEKGEYVFKTIVPGFYPADLNSKWYRPPHIHFLVTAMGFSEFVTQMYFKGEELLENDWIQELNLKDPLLQNRNLSREQRDNLVVQFKKDNKGELVGNFDIVLKN